MTTPGRWQGQRLAAWALAAVAASCTRSNDASQRAGVDDHPARKPATMSAPRVEPAAFVPWGPATIEPAREPILAGGFKTTATVRQRVRPLLLRLDPAGGLHVWNRADGTLASLGPDGAVTGKVTVAAADRARVVDVAAAADRFYLLLEKPGAVRAVARSGAELWTHAIAPAKPDHLVVSGDTVYVTAPATPATVLAVRADGTAAPAHTIKQAPIRVFAAGDGLVATTFFADQRRRGVVVYDPESGKETTAVGAAELYGPLLGAFGVDRERRLYLFGTALGSKAAALFQVGADAALLASVEVESIVAAGDRLLFVTSTPASLDVRIFARGAAPRTVTLARPTADQRLAVSGATATALLVDVLDPTGGLLGRHALDLATGAAAAAPPDDATVHGQQAPDTWQVTPDGAILVPVTSATGLTIARVTL